MTVSSSASNPCGGYRLEFRPLQSSNRGLAFLCNAAGRVPLDQLSRSDFNTYLYARALVGRVFGRPAVRSCSVGCCCGRRHDL
ncbi:conserved hypothetical protein [Leptothrix cholodnii SP-6]|uniref:Uncharacterized protein n=1 Tax=Leptothrix cholodnii (strain ATCC 51168 / LMG 8142 / SP-6) TaxID=395495 RepID=B1Y1N2_LEPCP|nr:conserved hypothetical protein [Leptothrix cholodnii SP-6]